MAFAIRADLRTSDAMTDIRLIRQALKRYTFDPKRAAFTDFTPTSVLYETYRRFACTSNKCAPTLNPTQFGVAVRLAFAIDSSRSCRRWCNGRKTMGYCHVRGPGSVTTREKSGNPKFDDQSSKKVRGRVS